MNGNHAKKNLFTKTAGFVSGVSAALLLSLPALAQQGPVDPNSDTSPTPAPAAPNTYSPSTGDPTIRITPGSNNSNGVDRTQNPNSVQQPTNPSQSGDQYRSGNQSTGSSNSYEANRPDTSTLMNQYQTRDVRALQAPAWRSRFDDRSTGLNQKNVDRLTGMDEDNDTNQYRNSTSSNNPVRPESRRTETNYSSQESGLNQDNSSNQTPGSTVAPSPYNYQQYNNQMDGSQNKQLQSDSPNQQNPNAGGSEGSGALGNRQSPTNRNSGSTGGQTGGDYQTPYGSQIPNSGQGSYGNSNSMQQRTTNTVDQQGGSSNVNTNGNTTSQPSYGGQAGGQGAGGQGTDGQSVPGLW
jgi:hypothetical protein